MTWFKVDDSFYDHPKVFDAPDCAVALWTRAGSWSARNLRDGFVPAGMPARLCDDPERAVRELLQRGLWLRAKGGYLFHDWTEYQPTRSEAIAGRQKMSTGGALGNHRRWHVGKGKPDPACRYCKPAIGSSGTDQPDTTRSDPDGSETNPLPDSASGSASGHGDYPQGQPDADATTKRNHQEQRDRVGHRVPDQPPDEIPESPPNPPGPSRPGPKNRGGTSQGVTPDHAREGPEPPTRCPKHQHQPAGGNCGPCGDARRHHDRWQVDHRRARAAEASADAHARNAAAAAQRAQCTLCDPRGYLPSGRQCTHDPARIASNGAARARAAIHRGATP